MIPAWVDGRLTPVEKLEVHQRGLKHLAVSVFVMDGDDVLIQRRALGKYHTPGLWANTCCTHPHWGEPAAQCAERRVFEELGIAGLTLEARDRIEYRADVGNGLIEHEVVDLFLARVTRPLPMEPNPDEVMDTSWMSMADLARATQDAPDRYTPWLKIYLAQHSDQIFA